MFFLCIRFPGCPCCTLPLAHVADDIDVRKELHLDLHKALARTRLAAAALDVEAEPAVPVAPYPRLRDLGEKIPDKGEDACIGGGVRAGGPADGGLVDVDDPVYRLNPWMADARPPALSSGRVLLQREGKGCRSGGSFSRAGNARDAGKDAERYIDVDILQVMGLHALKAIALSASSAPSGFSILRLSEM